ncbi:MAG TPA: response regulator transcription factor [Bacteroidia bacterium]|jgi:DNA-binding response OmpR family regulator|nr:response regulator transcription factor [Bacteroidia bacterium]
MKILVIEDEAELRKSIKEYLYNEGYVVESASDFLKASEKTSVYEYDCVLVDITLPHGSGLDIIKKLKKTNSEAGVIIISAKNSLDDKITGLEYGADDYITKPFHLPELNARIKALLRRKNFEGNDDIKVNDLTINTQSKSVLLNKEDLNLTQKEFDLLLFFVANKNKVITKEAIAERLWGDGVDNMDSYDFIYTHIKNLRKKIIDKKGFDAIKTVYAMGYKFIIE